MPARKLRFDRRKAKANRSTESAPVEARSRRILAAMVAFRDGNFSARLPSDWEGTDGRIAAAFNQTVSHEDQVSRGVDVHNTQRLAFLSASLATGAAVSLGGPVGFIGIVIPHLVRLIVGSDHRLVLPASALGGAAFLILCDTVSRTVLSPLELPVGVITAIIGGPFFLWLLIRNR